ncbi:MAG TPA: polysaccharide deacetylase family protein, partial [Gammaproteobacteria bacterium]
GRFWPGVFIDPQLFRQRLELLRRAGYRVAPLDQAVDELAQGGHAEPTVALTLDDGFASVASHGAPLLAEFGYPATLYVTSYHCATQTPVFRVALQYLCWKAGAREFSVADQLAGFEAPLQSDDRDALRRLYQAAEARLDEAARGRLLARVAERLGLGDEHAALLADRRFHNLDATTLAGLHRQGIDVQLHTHRHRLPLEPGAAAEELARNRDYLAAALGAGHPNRPLEHFCYPSGEWDPGHFDTLRAAGIRSATTLEPGLNAPGSEPLALRRITDNGRMDDLAFEAELSGLMDAARTLRRLAGRGRRALGRWRAQLRASLRHRRRLPAAPAPEARARVLFVCQGNICRSAFAEHALRRALGDAALVASCGLDVRESRPSPGLAVQAARALGIDLAAHRSQAIDAALVEASDLVLAMELRQLDALRARYPEHAAKFALLRDYAPLPTSLLCQVDDPYGGDLRAYARCFDLLQRCLEPLRRQLGSPRHA